MKHSKKLQTKNPPDLTNLPVVGIGASAGGIEALELLFKNLYPKTGMAFVIITHLDPHHESLAAEIFSRKTNMGVTQAENNTQLKPNCIYIIPPDHHLAIEKNTLLLTPRPEDESAKYPINYFFQSLAIDKKDYAIGVVFSGASSDGTFGLEAIKAEGGITIVQTPESAKFKTMPQSAIDANVADLIFSPKEIADEIYKIAKFWNLESFNTSEGNCTPQKLDEEKTNKEIMQILLNLKNQCNIDFTQYKQSTLRRRIARRMLLRNMRTLEEYGKYLDDNSEEVKQLFADILIHVTEFFRDKETFNKLKTLIFPKLLKNKIHNLPLRVWVVGCSTGEEAYSVAISFIEYLEETQQSLPIQIFATDISEAAVQRARNGVYPLNIQRVISQDRLNRFFTKVENGYKINKSLRDLCLFSRHDVIKDAPFAKLDLICCRNVLIYFELPLQNQTLSIFHYALNPGGYLWVGNSETVGTLSSHFDLVDKAFKFYTPKPFARPLKFQFPTSTYIPEKLVVGQQAEPNSSNTSHRNLQEEVDRISLDLYAPDSVVINQDMEIILVRGNTLPFLQLPHGQASLNLFKMARRELLPELRMLFKLCRENNESVRKNGLIFTEHDKTFHFNLQIVPIQNGLQNKDRYFLVYFERVLIEPKKSISKETKYLNDDVNPKDNYIHELETELAETKAFQESVMGDLENSRKELTAANEELQSTNEELQSTNEELESAKEELQSSNEELTTVNDELQERNQDLAQVNNDLTNLIACVEIPIVMVDIEGHIRRFSPKAGKVMNLIPTDVGRPIGNIKPNFEISNLQSLVAEVIQSSTIKEQEVQDLEGHWFCLQVRPYKTTEHQIEGAVLTMMDIDMLKRNLHEREVALNQAISVVNNIQLPLVVLNSGLKLETGNPAFYSNFGELAISAKDDFIGAFMLTDKIVSKLKSILNEVPEEAGQLHNLEVIRDLSHIGHKVLLLNAKKIQWLVSGPKAILLSLEDVTEQRRLQQSIQASEQKFHTLVEFAHDAIISVDMEGKIEFANQQVARSFGYTPEELIGQQLEILVPERLRKIHVEHRKKYLFAPTPRPMGTGLPLMGRRKDGTEFPVDISLSPSKIIDRVMVTAIVRDITDRKKTEDERDKFLFREQAARIEAERANHAKDAFIATLSHELRTSLTSILSWTQLIQQANLDTTQLMKGMDMIEQSAKSQEQLINDLLDVTRIQSGKLSLLMSEIDPIVPVKTAISAVNHMAELKKIKIEISSNIDIEKICADSRRLQQIVWNLLTNAIKFSSQHSKIDVYLENISENGRQFISITVADKGEGINPDFLPYIFQRFSQADNSSASHQGLGLGLAIVHDLTLMMNGFVRVESAGKGKGATFTILLPALSHRPADKIENNILKSVIPTTKTQNLIEPPNLTGIKLLIVENEPYMIEAISMVLRFRGAKTLSCNSIVDAMTAFPEFKPDVLISDIGIPGEDGYSLIKRIRSLPAEVGGNIPALALTAFAGKEDVGRAISAGYDMHMAKPFDLNQLATAVAALMKLNKKPE